MPSPRARASEERAAVPPGAGAPAAWRMRRAASTTTPTLRLAGERGAGPEPIARKRVDPAAARQRPVRACRVAPRSASRARGPVLVSEWLGRRGARGGRLPRARAHRVSPRGVADARADAPALPTFAYTAVGFADGAYWTSAFRVDDDPRQDPWRFTAARIRQGIEARRAELPRNRVARQLETCALATAAARRRTSSSAATRRRCPRAAPATRSASAASRSSPTAPSAPATTGSRSRRAARSSPPSRSRTCRASGTAW